MCKYRWYPALKGSLSESQRYSQRLSYSKSLTAWFQSAHKAKEAIPAISEYV